MNLEPLLEPITDRMDRLEKKLDRLLLLMQSIDDGLRKLQPAVA